jgi:hypothetical protein
MLITVAMLAFGAVGTASAALLNWHGTMVLELGELPALGNTGGGVATINNSAGGVPAHLTTLQLKGSRGAVAGTAMVPITDPAVQANAIASVRVQATMQTGTFAPISGGAASTTVLTKNILPVNGLAKVCLLSTTCTNYLPLLLTQPTTTNPPLSKKGLGIGGLLTIGAGTNPIRISIEAAPWTIKTGTSIDEITTPMTPMGVKKFTNRTAMGSAFVHKPASTSASFLHTLLSDTMMGTASPSGVVQLITPMQVVTNLPTGSNAKIALFGYIGVHFVPEPGMLLLLGSGVAGLLLLGRHRMRK